MNTYVTHYYECDNGMEFGIRSDDGKVVFMSLTNKDFYDTEPYIEDVENCKEYCLRYARETAISFIGSIDGYELIEEEPITRTKRPVCFQKTIFQAFRTLKIMLLLL